uniref:Uncharacterized protein, isoform C n=2 Tax=Drosophila melanogaster TaxID=7227 RepID=Q7KUV8_DROME|nr:uncharacterized protein Dmel_CG6023, isoform C [Drosophila melanogaster]AAS65401.2 uncharacterized protein Dmel_CG6023, isoform C [Drosophila melanogaster]|eukprot:NP_996503.2 uncharacterized protein Dmel_CG6023, isoform C [Drosophila melanogaster]
MTANSSASESFELQFLERLQQQQQQQEQEQSAPAATKASCQQQSNIIGRISTSKCWLLGILLLLTVATSWPTGTIAAPRRARGLSLILPHRNHARLHHHHQHTRSISTKIVPLLTNQTEGREQCTDLKMTPNIEHLQVALEVAKNTREAVLCLTKEWLRNQNHTLPQDLHSYSLHSLALKHPLQSEVKEVKFQNQLGDFVYSGKVTTLQEEMPAIIESLLVLEHLYEIIVFDHQSWNCYFNNFVHFFHHNMHEALKVAGLNDACNPRNAEYNADHIWPMFGAAVETIKVLTIIEHKYEQLIKLYQ